jgi:delta1-piperideine-2-carboxylate reductase
MTHRIDEVELTRLILEILKHAGVSEDTSRAVANSMVAAERDGTFSHGLARLKGYLSSIASGWVDGQAKPTVVQVTPSAIRVDAANGFAQGALQAGKPLLMEAARSQGIACLAIRNSHHFGSLWADVEPFADAGFVALSFVNTRSLMVAPGATRKVLGTNPMAFAAPRSVGASLVWDQASSVMAQGDVLIAAKSGAPLQSGAGVDKHGVVTDNAAEVLDGGSLLPFASHKGFCIAMMVEVLAATLTGGAYGYEDKSQSCPGAQTSNAGQTLILMDPQRLGAFDFAGRMEELMHALIDGGTSRLPGERRLNQRRESRAHGISVSSEMYAELVSLSRGHVPRFCET